MRNHSIISAYLIYPKETDFSCFLWKVIGLLTVSIVALTTVSHSLKCRLVKLKCVGFNSSWAGWSIPFFRTTFFAQRAIMPSLCNSRFLPQHHSLGESIQLQCLFFQQTVMGNSLAVYVATLPSFHTHPQSATIFPSFFTLLNQLSNIKAKKRNHILCTDLLELELGEVALRGLVQATIGQAPCFTCKMGITLVYSSRTIKTRT